MRATATALAAAALAGCTLYSGDATDDDEPIPEGRLAAATPIATGALAIAAQDDARVLLVTRDPATGDAVLRRHDVRDHATVELDRMPAIDGTPQILVVRQTIAWGFGGTTRAGTFRLVDATGAPRALDFAGHAPTTLLGHWPDPPSLTYASTRDCTIERLDLTTGAVEVRALVSCFLAFAEVAFDEHLAIWVRVDDVDASLTGVGMIDGLWPASIGYARTGMTDGLGPFASPGHYWFLDRNAGAAHADIFTGGNDQGPIPLPAESYAGVDAAVTAAALVDTTPWLASDSPAPALLPVEPTGAAVRYPVAYSPRRLVGLANRLIVLLDDGTVLEQSLTSR